MTLEDLGVNPETSPGSEPTTTPDVTPPSSSGQDAPPPSSSGEPDTGAASLLDVVKNVVEPKEEAQPETPAASADKATEGQPASEANDGADPAPADWTPEEMAKLSAKTQGRIKELVRERNSLKSELEALRAPAENFQHLSRYLESHQLTAEDTNLGLGIMAALRRGDFQTFLDGVQPYVQAAQQALGLTLPQDLADQVDQGLLPEDLARDYARTKAERDALAAAQREAEARAQASAVQNQAVEIRSAVASWEADVKARDPDFAAKQDTMAKFAKAIVAEKGLPKTPAEARQYAQLAYDEVNRVFAAARPKPQPTRPSPNGGQTATTSAAPEPKSLLDAVQLGLQKSRAGL